MLGFTTVRRNDGGDTLIEVIFAITVFSFIVVTAMSLMNQGAAAAQRSLEITTVRQQMEEYYKVIQEATGRGEASKFGDPKLCTTRDLKDFILNSRTAKLITTKIQPGVFKAAPIYAQITFITGNQVLNSEGIWIEGIRSDDSVDSTAPGYIDYHIRACWDVPGSNLPMNLGTIVRLYEPRA
jgi:type II secretory pathway pseudopilin PulG